MIDRDIDVAVGFRAAALLQEMDDLGMERLNTVVGAAPGGLRRVLVLPRREMDALFGVLEDIAEFRRLGVTDPTPADLLFRYGALAGYGKRIIDLLKPLADQALPPKPKAWLP